MKIKGLRWYIISLIGLSTVINFIDRSAINILWPYIHADFGITDADSKNALALITSFFLVAYAIGQTASGKIMDAIGTRIGMVASIAGWSISIALHALARGLFSFNIFRFMLGFFEAGNWPGATKSNAEWFPSRERAIAQGIFGSCTAVGSIIAAPIIAIFYLQYGWRFTFLAISVLGLLWIVPWLIINKSDPARHPWITEKEHDLILDRADTVLVASKVTPIYTWRQLLRFRNTWGIISARFFIDPVWWLFITWLPTFLKEQLSFDIKQIGAFSWLPYLLAAAGGVAGGYVSMRYIKSGRASHKARKHAISTGSLIMFISLAITAIYMDRLKEYPNVAMILIGIILFGFQFLISNLQTLPSDYFDGKNVGSIAGMAGTAAVAGTICTTWLVPVITKTSYASFFALGAILVPLAWACITFINSDKK